MDTGHWNIVPGVILTEETFGFIYEITNKIENKIYIGKKQCMSKRRLKPLKGKLRKRLTIKESDWKTYTSSSEKLNADIERLGKENFNFLILKTCTCKWEMAYYEIETQILRGAMFREDYYNGIINVRIGKAPKNLIKKEVNYNYV